MVRFFATILVVSVSSQAALALSCAPVSVEALYTRANDAAEAYVPVIGTFSQVILTAKPRIDPDFSSGEQGTASFSGHYISGGGELVPWSAEVLAETHCAASWCGGVPEGQVFLGFLRIEGEAYVFDGRACPQLIAPPAAADVARMQACLAGADCAPDF